MHGFCHRFFPILHGDGACCVMELCLSEIIRGSLTAHCTAHLASFPMRAAASVKLRVGDGMMVGIELDQKRAFVFGMSIGTCDTASAALPLRLNFYCRHTHETR